MPSIAILSESAPPSSQTCSMFARSWKCSPHGLLPDTPCGHTDQLSVDQQSESNGDVLPLASCVLSRINPSRIASRDLKLQQEERIIDLLLDATSRHRKGQTDCNQGVFKVVCLGSQNDRSMAAYSPHHFACILTCGASCRHKLCY